MSAWEQDMEEEVEEIKKSIKDILEKINKIETEG